MKRLFAFLAVPIASFAAAACTTATPDCTEWIILGDGPSRSLIYRTYPLDVPNERIIHATVILHGAGRDADNYYRTAVAAAFLARALEDTIVIAPRIASRAGGCQDTLAENEISYPCDIWRSGGAAPATPKVTSFDFMDEILRKVARKEKFPNLKSIVLAGHSAGGQYMNRYEMSSKVYDTLGVPVTYVVSNPSSYAYLDPIRPTGEGEDFGKEFRNFGDGRNCTTYDRWPYGMQNRNSGYTAGMSDEQLKKQLAARPVYYLLGGIDILPLGGFDGSCPAMAQGPTRRARGEAFYNYVNEKLGAKHKKVIVPLCGHNARCMFTSDEAQAILFPKKQESSLANRVR